MLNNILGFLKHPVTSMMEMAEKEDLKQGGIKLAIISGIMSLVKIITKVQSIYATYSKDSFYSYYSDSERVELRSKAFKDAELIGGFFKSWIIYLVVIAAVAAILFIIAKLVKSDKDYSNTLSMTNNTFIIVVAASIINIIVSLLYAPLGMVVVFASTVYASYSLIFAFRNSLGDVDIDKLVIVTTIVLTIVVVVVSLIVANQIKSSLGGLDSLSSFTSLLK